MAFWNKKQEIKHCTCSKTKLSNFDNEFGKMVLTSSSLGLEVSMGNETKRYGTFVGNKFCPVCGGKIGD